MFFAFLFANFIVPFAILSPLFANIELLFAIFMLILNFQTFTRAIGENAHQIDERFLPQN
ncbi:hypothetical protein D1B33_17250 [Lysinibacillus yapensis]|uniref:Uncharacterized protein n=1 Tax=Ureibacillus yapensis TaxID=2304605 RepID=A0A396S9M0_9BACL|nr:hypothetical protein D1B33_17250 [Lysinibacillus yapensis]